jgi:O-antigen ligase
LTPLGVAVFGFAVWLIVTNLWANSSYTAAAPYHASFLLGGFLLGRRARAENAVVLFAAALVFAVTLSAWAVWQRVAGVVPRSHALFETPATLASVINLVLLPGLVLVGAGKRNAWLLVALGLVAAALISTVSRGGWLALTAGGLAAFVLLRRAATPLERKSVGSIAAIFAAGYVISLLAPLTWDTTFGTAPASAAMRLDLYRAAVNAMTPSSWLIGSGYLAFYYVLQAVRPVIPGYQEATTYFVHNDYLQVLLELGAPGLVLLLLVGCLPVAHAWRMLPKVAPHLRVIVVALATATTSMTVHALVDFPFYIPVCLLIYGACAGLLVALGSTGVISRDATPGSTSHVQLHRAVRAGLATLLVWILAKPLAAEAAAAYAQHQLRATRAESAAYWYEAARRIEPRDWRYHWYVGQFWFAQAQINNNAKAAALADRAFAEGFAANPREVANLLWRISTHVYLRSLLGAPVDRAKLREWGDLAFALAPLEPAVKAQRDLIARFEANEVQQ